MFPARSSWKFPGWSLDDMRTESRAWRQNPKSWFHLLLLGKHFGFRASDADQEQMICRVTEASGNSPTSTSTDSVFYRFESFKQEEKAGTCWFILLENPSLFSEMLWIYLNEDQQFGSDEKKHECSSVWMEAEFCSQRRGRNPLFDWIITE